MSASSEERKTLAYQLGEAISERTDHLLLMTATPHKGAPDNFCLFLRLLDKDVYADISSLEKAMKERTAPFYLRRVKEAMVSFPNPDTGEAKSLFTKRNVKTVPFQIADKELDFYDALTRYVEDQSIKAAADNSARGRALGSPWPCSNGDSRPYLRCTAFAGTPEDETRDDTRKSGSYRKNR
jgi:hypothetical protein